MGVITGAPRYSTKRAGRVVVLRYRGCQGPLGAGETVHKREKQRLRKHSTRGGRLRMVGGGRNLHPKTRISMRKRGLDALLKLGCTQLKRMAFHPTSHGYEEGPNKEKELSPEGSGRGG